MSWSVYFIIQTACVFFVCFLGFLLICEPKASIFLCITKKVQKHKSCLIYLCLFQYLLWSTKGVQPREVHQCYEKMLITGSLVNLVIKFSITTDEVLEQFVEGVRWFGNKQWSINNSLGANVTFYYIFVLYVFALQK